MSWISDYHSNNEYVDGLKELLKERKIELHNLKTREMEIPEYSSYEIMFELITMQVQALEIEIRSCLNGYT